MRKVYSVLIGIFFTLAFTTCKQFNADIDEYLSYWSAEAFIRSASIEAVTQTDVTGVASVASEKDVTVTLKVQNPKSFRFALPSASETRNIVHFEHLTEAKPVASTDYELKQLEGDTLQLIYKTGFLKKHEWGEKDLSSVITLIAQDGRVFKQTYTFRIKANTPPPKPIFTVAKTVGTPAYYVLCITVPNMDKRVSGGLLHKDITRIEVNGTPYTFSVNEAHNAFTKPESDLFITASNVEKLNEQGAEEVPAGGWVLHYKTDVEVKDGAAKKEYTVRLSDEKGLVSGILNASTKPNKPTAEGVTITKGERVSGSGGESDPVIIGSDSAGAALAISSATGGTTVHCTLTDIDSAAFVQYDGNPITVPLPLNGAGEKKYKLEYYTDGEGFAATAVKTVYYTIRERYTVTFDANGGTPVPDAQTVLHGGKVADPSASVSKTGYYLDGWYTEKAYTHKWDFNTDTVTRTITLYANWIGGSGTAYTVEHYQQNIDDNNYSIVAADTEHKTGTTGQNAAYTPKTGTDYPGFEYDSTLTKINGVVQTSGTIKGDGSTIVRLYYKRKQITITFKLNGGNVGGSTGDVTRTGKYGATLQVPAPQFAGHTLSGWDPALPSSPTFPATNTTYTAQWGVNVTFSVDGGNGTLTATVDGNTIQSGNTVEHGKNIIFTATPATSAGAWKVASWTKDNNAVNGTNGTYTLSVTADTNVTVTFYQSEITDTPSSKTEWRDLLSAVRNAPANATIEINGEINATPDSGNNGEIVINKNLTIKGKTGAGSDSLSAITLSRIFKVKTGNALTLENITLKNGGKIFPAPEDGGGIYSEGTLTLKNTTIESCGGINGGGVYVGGGTFEMQGSSKITDCSATEKGGGVYVKEGAFKMSGSATVTPKADTPGKHENDVYLESGKTITVDSTLTGTAPVARITPREYTAGHLYLTDSGVGTHHLKFTVPPQKVTEDSENWNVFWYIAADGTLKAEVEDSSLLQEVINGSPNNTIIKLGNISDLKTVEIWGYTKIMLKADRKVTLTCPSKGNEYKHLQVKEHASLILKGQITLQGTDYGSNSQYALFVERGCKAEIKNGVTITGFKNGNIGPVVSDGELTMSGGEISDNKAKNGGGVYIHAAFRSFTMTGGTIKGNTATEHGGGVYVNGDGPLNMQGSFTMLGGTIDGNTADKGGGVYSQGSFTMSGGTITKNKANTAGKAVMLNHYFYWQGGEIKDNLGSCSVIGGSGYYFNNTSGNTAS